MRRALTSESGGTTVRYSCGASKLSTVYPAVGNRYLVSEMVREINKRANRWHHPHIKLAPRKVSNTSLPNDLKIFTERLLPYDLL